MIHLAPKQWYSRGTTDSSMQQVYFDKPSG